MDEEFSGISLELRNAILAVIRMSVSFLGGEEYPIRISGKSTMNFNKECNNEASGHSTEIRKYPKGKERRQSCPWNYSNYSSLGTGTEFLMSCGYC